MVGKCESNYIYIQLNCVIVNTLDPRQRGRKKNPLEFKKSVDYIRTTKYNSRVLLTDILMT